MSCGFPSLKEVEEGQKNSSGGFSLASILAGVVACSEETMRFCGYMLLAGAGLVTLTDIYYYYIKRQ